MPRFGQTAGGTTLTAAQLASLNLDTADQVKSEMASVSAMSSLLGLGLTRFSAIQLGSIATGTNTSPATPPDGGGDGGVISPAAAVQIFNISVFTKVLTGTGSISFPCSWPNAGVGANIVNECGLINAAQLHVASIASLGDVGDNTHDKLHEVNGTRDEGSNVTVANDGLKHWRRLAFDTTKLYFFLDGVLVDQKPKTRVIDEPMFPFIYNSTTSLIKLYCDSLVVGFVG